MRRWPDTLPQAFSEGYRLSPVDQAVRTEMEVGADRSRRQTFARHDTADARWKFTDAQMAAFRAWHDDDPWSLLGDSDLPGGWGTTNAVVAEDGFIGPDDTASTRVTETVPSGVHLVGRQIAGRPDNTILACATTLRSAGRPFVRLVLITKGVVAVGVRMNLTTGAIVSIDGSPTGISVTGRGNGWYRVAFLASVGTGGFVPEFRIHMADAAGSYVGHVGSPALGVDACEMMAHPATGYDLFVRTGADGRALGAAGGSAWTLMPLSFGGGLRLVEARFTGPWDAQALSGLNWQVGAKLEVRNA